MTTSASEEGSAVAPPPLPGPPLPHAPPVPIVNLANGLTLLRLALVPVFAVALLVEDGDSAGWRVVATVVFLLASFTDRVDGQVARSRGLVTAFGTVADPIADKALMITALGGLSILGELSWWVTVVIAVREVGVTLLRFWVIRHGVIPASRGGKAKTALQGLAIALYLLPLSGVAAGVAATVMGAAVAITVLTGADYVWRAMHLRRTSDRAALKRARRAQG